MDTSLDSGMCICRFYLREIPNILTCYLILRKYLLFEERDDNGGVVLHFVS